MPWEHKCPLCDDIQCYDAGKSSTGGGIWFDCRVFNIAVKLHNDIDLCRDEAQRIKYCNLIFEHCVNNPTERGDPWFYYDSTDVQDKEFVHGINLNNIPYPQSFTEKTDRILLNLSKLYPKYDAQIPGNYVLDRAYFCSESDPNEKYLGIAKIMIDMGYLKEGDFQKVTITSKGWQRIDEVEKRYESSTYCFIAMAFRDETIEIRKAIKFALGIVGYKPIIMDEVEHNEQIVPEMLYEIRRCRFLIMDATVPNLGAYYEAGYAAGCGKQVILCCRKDKYESDEKPHFDIQQQSTIVWEDRKDLIQKLKRRIEATIGKPGYKTSDLSYNNGV